MARLARPLIILLLVLGVGIPARHLATGTPAVAASAGLHIQATLTATQVVEGERASLFVHTGALASLTLTVTYAGGIMHTYTGKTDSLGRHVFSWLVPLGQHLAGVARLQIDARRGDLHGRWSGALPVRAAPLPQLFVQPLQSRVVAGNPISLFVNTVPGAEFSYRLVADDGTVLAQGGAQADSQGRYVLSVHESLLPKYALGVTATISVTQPAGTHLRTLRLLLLPRAPLPLFVASTMKTARAGEAVDVFVATTPGSKLTITVALTSTVVVSATGVAGKDGRWVYTGILYVALKHPITAHVTVHASHGLDQGTGHTSFLLRPGPSGLMRGGIQDRLATAVDPTPQLERYFTTIPDKLIVVSTEGQTLRAYDHGALVHEDYVTTGRPELPTPHGIFQVMARYSPFTFISPWPAGSPYYYPPSPVRFALLFRDGGYFLHDAPWRSVYGPGTNLPHSSDPGEPLGTHGCINIPLSDMVWLWNFAGVGTTVIVI